MKLALFVAAGAVSVAALLPTAALADSVVYDSSPSSISETTTVRESAPSTTVVREEPVYIAPSEKTTIVDKRKKHHLISLPFVHVL